MRGKRVDPEQYYVSMLEAVAKAAHRIVVLQNTSGYVQFHEQYGLALKQLETALENADKARQGISRNLR